MSLNASALAAVNGANSRRGLRASAAQRFAQARVSGSAARFHGNAVSSQIVA